MLKDMSNLSKVIKMKRFLFASCVILTINLYILLVQVNQSFWSVQEFFEPVTSTSDQILMIKIAKKLTEVFDSNNVTYFMNHGTLLGSYRHGGVIPWDDDLDLTMNATGKNKIHKVLKKLEPEFELYIPVDNDNATLITAPWKLYYKSTKPFYRSFGFPYVDLFFFHENSTHIWNAMPRYLDVTMASKDIFFPLYKRPFNDIMLNSPCGAGLILKNVYGDINSCKTREYSHIYGVTLFWQQVKDVPCSILHPYFPFVSRSETKNNMIETIQIGDIVQKTLTLPKECVKVS